MFRTFQQLAGTALIERITLLLNHIVNAETAAVERLRPHAGRCIALHLSGWPKLLPAMPELVFVVTPAGLVEWCGTEPVPASDLQLSVDMSNPARTLVLALEGQRPQVSVSGDAALAGDVSWLMDNLRWDIEDDLARLIGQGPASELARAGRAVAQALRQGFGTLANVAARARPSGAEPPPQ